MVLLERLLNYYSLPFRRRGRIGVQVVIQDNLRFEYPLLAALPCQWGFLNVVTMDRTLVLWKGLSRIKIYVRSLALRIFLTLLHLHHCLEFLTT